MRLLVDLYICVTRGCGVMRAVDGVMCGSVIPEVGTHPRTHEGFEDVGGTKK